MSAPSVADARRVRAAGFNLTVLRLEVRRLFRNRRTVIFALVLPVVLFLFVGTNKQFESQSEGHGNLSMFLVVSMALYGAALATTAGGAMVSIERAQGWSRQLRLTPLSPLNYILIKAMVAMLLGLSSVVAVFAVGKITGVPQTHPGYAYLWFVSALLVWIGSLVFAALGLFIGYLLPSENVMQILGLVVGVLAFAGGLFYPEQRGPDPAGHRQVDAAVRAQPARPRAADRR